MSESPTVLTPTEMLQYQCKRLWHQNQLLTEVLSELQEQCKVLKEHSIYLDRIRLAANVVLVMVILGFVLSMCSLLRY